jgi:DNA-binding CsgD family transcriptional regulator
MGAIRPYSPAEEQIVRTARTVEPLVPVKEVARRLGRTENSVRNQINRMGLAVDRSVVTAAMVTRALAMKAKGQTWAEVGAALKVNPDTIKHACGKRAEAPKKNGGTLQCLTCTRPFRSVDRVKNRICGNCKCTEVFGLGPAMVA